MRFWIRSFKQVIGVGVVCLTVVSLGQTKPQESNLFPTTKGSKWTFKGTFGDKPIEMGSEIVSSKSEKGATTVVFDWTVGGTKTQQESYEVTTSEVRRIRSGPNGANPLEPALPVI